MKHTITFRLNDPTPERWATYLNMLNEIDIIYRKHKIHIEKRLVDHDSYEITAYLFVPSIVNLHDASFKILKVLTKAGISTTVVYNQVIERPRLYTSTSIWTLSEGYRNDIVWHKWEKLMEELDLFAGDYGCKQTRIKDKRNYSCEITVEFSDFEAMHKLIYHSGQMMAHQNIIIEPEEEKGFSEIMTEDIFDEISFVTRQHKQLSLF